MSQPSLHYVDSSNWPKPNYVDPPVFSTLLPSFEYLLLSLSTILIGGRLVSRGYLLKSLGLDDLFIVLALVFALIVTISNMLLLGAGFGRHTWDVDPKQIQTVLYHVWLSQWTPAICAMFTKLSIVCFYMRFVMGKVIRRCCVATMVFIVVWSMAVTIAWMARCVPAAYWWRGGHGKCMSVEWIGILTAWQMGLNLFTHILLLVLPMSTLWKLQMHWLRKLSLVVLLGFGLTCCVFGSLRLKRTLVTIKMDDPSWIGYECLMLNIMEIQGGIIYACVPFMKPITLRLVSPVRSMVQRRSKGLFSTNTTDTTSTKKSTTTKSSSTSRAATPGIGERVIRIQRPEDDLEVGRDSTESRWKEKKVDVTQRAINFPLEPERAIMRAGSSLGFREHRRCDSENTVSGIERTVTARQEDMCWLEKPPANVFGSNPSASASVVSMSTIATDGSGLMKSEEEELTGLSPAQIPRPRTGSKSST